MDYSSVVADPCGNWFISGSSRGVVTLWDLRFYIRVNSWQYSLPCPIEKMCLFDPPSGTPLSIATRMLVYVAAVCNEVSLCNAENGSCHQRFYEHGGEAQVSQDANLKPSMDIFAVGTIMCVIAELFLEGRPLHELSQLLAYRRGQYDPTQHLEKIPDSGIHKMILHMIQLDPESRCSAESYLQNNVGFVFPCYFSPFLHKFYSLLNPQVLACETSFQEILRQMPGNRAVEDAISERETSNNDTRHLSGYGKQGPAGADKSLNGRKETKKVNTRDHFDLLYDMSTRKQEFFIRVLYCVGDSRGCGDSPGIRGGAMIVRILQHMRSGGKENSMPYQVISSGSSQRVGTAKDSKSGKDATTLTILQVDLSQLVVQGKGCTQDYANLRVLNEHPEIQSFSAFNSICNHSALFGIQGTSESGFAIHALAIADSELIAVATPGQVDAVQLDRAKQSTKSAILMNLESRMVAAEDIGKQVLTWRKNSDA
ncbi:hypothetical protein OROMI_019310 [Orobanche minor]